MDKDKFQDGRGGGRASVFWYALALGLIGLDQLIKNLIFNHGPSLASGRLIGFTKFHNYQFAFSIHMPGAAIFIIYALVLSVLLVYVIKYHSSFSQLQWLAWTLIFAGSLSNIGERIIFGYVRDFLYLYGGSIINLADIYILSGILILILGKKGK